MKISFNNSIEIAHGAEHVDAFSLSEGSGEAQLYIACGNPQVKTNMVEQLSARYSASRSFSTLDANEALDNALRVDGSRVKKCDMTLLLLHRGGALAMQMGEGRLLQLRPGERNALYDSRDQVLDIYTSRAKVMPIDDIKAGDSFVLSTGGRFDTSKLLELFRKAKDTGTPDADKLANIIAVPSLMLPVASVEGSAGGGLAMNKKWWKVVAWLIAGLAALAALTFFVGPMVYDTIDEAEVIEVDTTGTTNGAATQAAPPEALPEAEAMPEQPAERNDRPAARERNEERRDDNSTKAEEQKEEPKETPSENKTEPQPTPQPKPEPAPAPAPTPTPEPEA